MIDPQQADTLFEQKFGRPAEVAVTSPGRVNLIGEHVDYNDGLVLPMAIDHGTTLAARRRDDNTLRLWAERFGQEDTLDAGNLDAPGRTEWSNYVRGVAALLVGRGVEVGGADIAIATDLPVGGGLSSSASLEVAAALALLALADAEMDPLELARLCQQAEHEFAGVPCGLMDQYSVVFGRAGMAVLLDCRTQEHELVPAEADGVAWTILDNNAPRQLAAGGYAQRRRECDAALAILHDDHDIDSLRDATEAMLATSAGRLGDVLLRRARHVVGEIARVEQSADAMRRGRFDRVGQLMYESHESLAADYEVTIPELDHVVEVARETPGVYGCRMTGGGFGGCLIALTTADARQVFTERAGESCRAKFNRDMGILPTAPADGATVVKP